MFWLVRGPSLPACVISTVVHTAVLGTMALYHFSNFILPLEVSLETTIVDERSEPDFQDKLRIDTSVSQNPSIQSGGIVSTQVGGMQSTGIGAAALGPVQRTKIEQSEVIRDPGIKVTTIGDISISGVTHLGLELGEREVSGEVGARVSGYGAAMSRMTEELLRMMRQQPVLVVWMFDASNSLKDDRVEIVANFHKIYDELRIAQDEPRSRNVKYSPLQTMVCSFAQDLKKLLPAPTSDIERIKGAIDAVEDDESGVELTFTAISRVLDEYAQGSTHAGRKLVLVVVTDETGNDDEKLEEVVGKADRYKVPVYFMGREAIFGYPTAFIHWQDPASKQSYWIPVDRGPETAFPECLQYDGLHERWDSASSGFGPYGQVRLVKESGGIFFLLASREENLVGSDEWGPRRYSDLAMKQYEPLLTPRREYEQERNANEFRSTIWQVIVAVNPNLDDQLKLQTDHFSIDHKEFLKQRETQFGRCLRALGMLNEGIRRLERVQPLRPRERSLRWRAAFDLCYAQLLSYRVRQFQYLLLLDQHAQKNPQPQNKISNEWVLRHTQELLAPTPEQIKATQVDLKELEKQREQAIAMYDRVISEHPGTPWARRAELERTWGFGFNFYEEHWEPYLVDVKVPKF